MGNTGKDPVDHVRTTRKHAGQNLKNTTALPALIAVGLGAFAVFIALFMFASGRGPVGVIAAVGAVLLMLAGFGWLKRERRRVRRLEMEYLKLHPDADIQMPAS